MITLLPGYGSLVDLDAELAAHYAYPDDLSGPWVRVNFVASADGAATSDGRSGGLGTAADKRVFGLLRELADVVLVGAGTVRVEDYRGARRGAGQNTPPPIAVVTGSADLDPRSRLFTDTSVAPLVLTLASASAQRRDGLAAAGAEVVVLDDLQPASLLADLGRRGLHRVLCEGGPMLFGALVAAGAVDELCLTITPLLVGGTAARIISGPPVSPACPLTLVGVLEADGTLLLRYRRATPIG
jgi:5-amino-6-(5-phosphoribosylamino)uracil reductase